MNMSDINLILIPLLTAITLIAASAKYMAEWMLAKTKLKAVASDSAASTAVEMASNRSHLARRSKALGGVLGLLSMLIALSGLTLLAFGPDKALTTGDAASIATSLMLFYVGAMAMRG